MPSQRLLHAFHGKPSSNPIKIAIVLEELGLDYEISSLSRESNDQQSPSHTALHPNGKVPVLTDVNGVITWETISILQYLVSEYDLTYQLSREDKQQHADMVAWYSLQATALAPYAHLYLAKKDIPELQQSRPFFRNEVLRLLRLLDTHLSNSKPGFISAYGYSFADIGWVVYTDHYVQRGIGFTLEEFPSVKKWHEVIYRRPGIASVYEKLGIASESGSGGHSL